MYVFNIPYSDKSLVGGKVSKCTTSTTEDTIIIVYFIPIAEYKVYVNPARWYAGLKYILELHVQFR